MNSLTIVIGVGTTQ